jgi:hypothetical protein
LHVFFSINQLANTQAASTGDVIMPLLQQIDKFGGHKRGWHKKHLVI